MFDFLRGWDETRTPNQTNKKMRRLDYIIFNTRILNLSQLIDHRDLCPKIWIGFSKPTMIVKPLHKSAVMTHRASLLLIKCLFAFRIVAL